MIAELQNCNMLFNLIVVSLVYVAHGAHVRDQKPHYDLKHAEAHFEEFLTTFNKSYDTDAEYKKRLEIFTKNLEKINHLNRKHENTTFGINMLSDITPEERSAWLGLQLPIEPLETVPVDDFEGVKIPDSLDWRDHNGVTPVKNQGQCGSCWAFSAVAVIESQVAIYKKQQLDLAEQQFVDCDTTDKGCNYGVPYKAFQYAGSAGGMMSEEDYPYKAADGTCAFDANKVAVKVKGGINMGEIDEEKLAKVIAGYGPVSIALCMSSEMDKYAGGVLTPTDCGGPVDHAVALVGYGTENGTPFWIIKNSWGTSYGEAGYLRLARGQGLCSVNKYVSFVDLA